MESIIFWRMVIAVLAEARVTTSGERVMSAKSDRTSLADALPTEAARLLI